MHPYHNSLGQNSNRGRQAAQALASALTNPYGYGHQHASHYTQAYFGQQTMSNVPTSGTYPSITSTAMQSNQPQAGPSSRGSHFSRSRRGGSYTQRPRQPQTHWYEQGNNRCNYERCTFIGSKSSVEIHMMDRHLIYPPGWDKRKRKPEWDADPSLNNGKPIIIQGTSVTLDTPEAISAWIADRRKRWPTASRVEEKSKKLEEAVARGEIAATEMSFRGRKRTMMGEHVPGRGQKRPRGKPRETPQNRQVHPLPKKPEARPPIVQESISDDESSSISDMDPEKDAVSSKRPDVLFAITEPLLSRTESKSTLQQDAPRELHLSYVRKPAAQPRPASKNSFGNKTSLLRSLLLPEIRMTVSNLSQAIHFLVENDFLENVELKPGQAEEKPIEVIGTSSTSGS